MLSMDGHNISIPKRFCDIDLYTKTEDVKKLAKLFSLSFETSHKIPH